MRKIAQANIDRYNALLKDETDPVKRAMVVRLRAEEQDKLKSLPKPERKQG
jgi:hypothetical protein